jgi:hypothetical protein
MEKNPRRTKAFIITFIAVFILLLIGYFIFFRNGGGIFTKSINNIQKTFSPLLGGSKNKNLNPATNGTGTNGAVDIGGSGTGGVASNGTGGNSGNGGSNVNGNGTAGSSTGISGTGGNVTGGGVGSGGSGTTGSTGAIGGVVGYVPQCRDKIDNDKDGKTDADDKDCHIDNDLSKDYNKNGYSEFETTKGTVVGGDVKKEYVPQCSDGADNDKVGGTDKDDKDCHIDGDLAKAYDPDGYSEFDESGGGTGGTTGGTGGYTPACSDWQDTNKDGKRNVGDFGDNDKDGKIDQDDKDCHIGNDLNKPYSKNGYSEASIGGGTATGGGTGGFLPECSDGADNDKDGMTDIDDPECHTDLNPGNRWKDDAHPGSYDPDGYTELTPQCRDGIDNDGNGKMDASDPGCWTDDTDSTTYDKDKKLELGFGGGGSGTDDSNPQCSDNSDNDGDNLVDEDDPGCWIDHSDSNTYNKDGSNEYNTVFPPPTDTGTCVDGIKNGDETGIDTGGRCESGGGTGGGTGGDGYIDACTLSLMKAQLLTNQTEIDKLEAAAILAYNNSFVIKAGTRGIWPPVKKGGGGAGPIGTGTPTYTECSDGADNDANGFKDRSDASCHTDGNKYNLASYDKTIAKELNLPVPPPIPLPDCADGIDNDKNGQTDATDPGCWSNMLDSKTYVPSDNYESVEITECNDGVDNDGNGVKDAGDPACWSNQKLASSYNPNNPYENLVGSYTIPHTQYTRITIAVQTKNGTLNIPVILLGIMPGQTVPTNLEQISSFLNKMGYDKQAVDSTGQACLPPPIPPQCNDWVDVNGNGRQDAGDKGDNDGDGLIDRADPGCHIDNDPIKPWDKFDNAEFSTGVVIRPPYVPACRDGVDNDGDNLADEDDPGCHSDLNPYVTLSYTPDKTSELDFIPDCRDTKDNDGDNLADQLDPGCHTDLDPNNNGPTVGHPDTPNTYDPNLYSEFNLIPQCRDGKDNDGNKLSDSNDPGCYTDLKITKKTDGTIDTTNYDPNKAIEFKFLAQCSDGIDNDNKNDKDDKDPGCWVDKNDPNSYDPEDSLELEWSDGGGYLPQCSDTIDNDKDSLVDEDDPQCVETYVPTSPECSDGVDNDGDGKKDRDEADCHLRGLIFLAYRPGNLYENPKTAKIYYPERLSESELDGKDPVVPIVPPSPLDESCVDVPLTFTKEQLAELGKLTREFNLIALTLKTDADVIIEKDKKRQYDDLVKISKDLTQQCFDQKKASPLKSDPLDSTDKFWDRVIPQEMLPNPYSSSPADLAGMFSKNPVTDLKLFQPAYSYVHEHPIYSGSRRDEVSRADLNWDYWMTHLVTKWFSPEQIAASPITYNHFMYHLVTNSKNGHTGGGVPACSDGTDNDGDGKTDGADRGCWRDPRYSITFNPNGAVELESPIPLTECNDNNIDNDGDNLKDSLDPGCHTNNDLTQTYNPGDNSESEYKNTNGGITVPECSDGIDNNHDNLTDKDDAGCNRYSNSTFTNVYDPNNNSEATVGFFTPPTECSDNLDNDGDGFANTDRYDKGCWTDPNDPNTYDANDDSEFYKISSFPVPECIDGIDSDKDSKEDALDPGCWSDPYNPATYDENNNTEYDSTITTGLDGQIGGMDTSNTDCLTTSYFDTVTYTSRGGYDSINHKCQNQPIFGLYDIKNIVDAAWIDYMNQGRNVSGVSKAHLQGRLSVRDLYPNIPQNSAYSVSNMDDATWKDVGKMFIGNFSSLGRSTVTNNSEIPDKIRADKGQYNYRDIGIWGIINMYAGDYYNSIGQPLNESRYGHFCNWQPNVNRKNEARAGEGDNIIAHNDPHDRNIIVCPFLKGMLTNFGKLGDMDIRDLKRQVDDLVYKVHDAPDEQVYWAEATPLTGFEKNYVIW